MKGLEMELTARNIATLQDLYYNWRLWDGSQPRMVIKWALAEFGQSDYEELVALKLATVEIIKLNTLLEDAKNRDAYETMRGLIDLAVNDQSEIRRYQINEQGITLAKLHPNPVMEQLWK